MPKKPLEAGSSVVSECFKCKGPTGHTVVVMVKGSVAKVQCKVCGGRHAFRPFVPGAAKPPVTRKAPGKKPAKKSSVVTQEWEEKVASADPAAAKPYAMDGTYGAGQVIDHPLFGLGYVQRTIRPDKIEVLFRESLKKLRCRLQDSE
ncbi:MAG: hypothetical protein ACOCVU_00170 [Desulfohalobiaceae bacterium]